MIRIVALSTLIVAGFAVSADAQMGRDRGAALWQDADTDNDGRITRAEVEAARAAQFAAADADGDGQLTEAELAASHAASAAERAEAQAARRISRMDVNGDGTLSIGEIPSMMRIFDRLDTNGDGAIDADERAQARYHRGEDRKGHRRDRG